MASGYDDRYDPERDAERREDRAEGGRGSGAIERARQRVSIPAILILLNALAGLVIATTLLVVGVISPQIMVDILKQMAAMQPPGPDKQKAEKQIQDLENQVNQNPGGNAVRSGIQVGAFALLNLIAAFGAIKMRSMGSYGWGLAASIISLIPCTTGCCCTGLPLGLWGLIVLMNEDVKAGFAAAARQRGFEADRGYDDRDRY